MVNKNVLLQKLKPYVGSLKIVKYDQGTNDIIKELLKSHEEQASEYDKIYPYFIGKNVKQTAQNIFDFLKRNVKYNIEPGSKQTLKSPSSIIAQGYGDCKQYAQFIGGILGAMQRNRNGADWVYRFASYNPDNQIQHVFVVVKDDKGNNIWIDPVLNTLNERKKYTFKIDKKPKENMALYKISGMDNQVGKFSWKQAFSLKNIVNTVKKVAVPVASLVLPGVLNKVGGKILEKIDGSGKIANIIDKVKDNAPQLTKVVEAVNKVASVENIVVNVDKTVARNAFLTLVSSNKSGLATKLGASMSQIGPALQSYWIDLGGDYNTLQSTILSGSRNAISGVDKNFYSKRIGATISAESIYATALPVIEVLKPILEAVGVDVNSLVKTGTDEAVTQVANNIITTNQTPPSVEKQPVIEKMPGGQTIEAVKADVKTTDGTASLNIGAESGSGYSKFVLPAVALGALYLLTKKK